MSKQRPSNSIAANKKNSSAHAQSPASQWLGRLFRNSYTRDGKCHLLEGWAVKFQHEGRRHTFSLWAKSKKEAALEAKAIHDTILSEGWEAAKRNHPPRTRADEAFPKTDARYWRQRLMVRRYYFSASGGSPLDLAARIDHMGLGYFFPLGTSDPDGAAARAQVIHQSVIKDGWGAASRKYSRELIVGLEWAADPILLTYITVHTLTSRKAGIGREGEGSGRRILIVENDAAIRRALVWCVHQQPGYGALGCEPDGAFKRTFADFKPHFVLLNRSLAGRIGFESPGQLAEIAPGIPAVTYSIYPDSDQLFVSTPGGLEGYVFKRLKPERLLEPIFDTNHCSARELPSRIRSYFKGLLQSRADSEASGLARLTPREREVMTLLSKGSGDKEIAQALGISAWTVHGHIKKIFERLRVRTRTEAVVRYMEK